MTLEEELAYQQSRAVKNNETDILLLSERVDIQFKWHKELKEAMDALQEKMADLEKKLNNEEKK